MRTLNRRLNTFVVTRKTDSLWQKKKSKFWGVQINKFHVFPIKIKGKKSNTLLCKLSSPGWLHYVHYRTEWSAQGPNVCGFPFWSLSICWSFCKAILIYSPKHTESKEAVGTKAQIAIEFCKFMSWLTSWRELIEYLVFKTELHVLGRISPQGII